MKYENVYFFNGSAYAGKSTLVKNLAEKFGGIACEENYHDQLDDELTPEEFPGLCYTRDLDDWAKFIRRTPDEYEAWIDMTAKECATLEFRILDKLVAETARPIFVDTNISVEQLHEVSDEDHVIIMLADPDISVKRFFERPDREKQFLYQLLLREADPDVVIANFRECLRRINSVERYKTFENSGFHVLYRDENRSPEATVELAAKLLKIEK